jgi:hypothetical protein
MTRISVSLSSPDLSSKRESGMELARLAPWYVPSPPSFPTVEPMLSLQSAPLPMRMVHEHSTAATATTILTCSS